MKFRSGVTLPVSCLFCLTTTEQTEEGPIHSIHQLYDVARRELQTGFGSLTHVEFLAVVPARRQYATAVLAAGRTCDPRMRLAARLPSEWTKVFAPGRVFYVEVEIRAAPI